MQSGIISEFDHQGLFGVIDADNGNLLLFNLAAAKPEIRRWLDVGSRVIFEIDAQRTDRAVSLMPAVVLRSATGELVR